jgi:hydroxyacylglutathione hydrolase
MECQKLITGGLQTNCYILSDPHISDVVIVDPGDDAEYIIETVEKLHPLHVILIATHGHFDHIMAAYTISLTYRTPLCIHDKDVFLISRMESSAKYFLGLPSVDPPPTNLKKIQAGDTITLGSNIGEILELPGHTPGSIGIYFPSERRLFSGDVIFADGSVGRTDFAYSSLPQLQTSIDTLLKLPSDTIVNPGHGDVFTITDFYQKYRKDEI